MTKKPFKKFQPKPTFCKILGSSNNVDTDKYAHFCLEPKNLSKSGAHCKIGIPKNYCNFALGYSGQLCKRSIYLICLSWNHFLRTESQIKYLHLTYVKAVLQLIRILSENGLNIYKNLIIITPPLRFYNTSTYPIQLQEIQHLKSKLLSKNIFCVDINEKIPTSILENNYFDPDRSDGVHYSIEVEKIISQTAAAALQNFMDKKWSEV